MEVTEPHVHEALPELPAEAAVLERAARLLSAAGEPSRLRLLLRLAAGEACVSALAEAEGDALSTVSQRLTLLHREGLVTRRREGRHIVYGLEDDHVLQLVHNALAHAGEAHGG